MKEDFLHYLWKFKKFTFAKAETTSNKQITLVSVGQHNLLAGPDFFNASLHIDGQLWAGNVEIHIKSSDWYAHGHETDVAYDNVVLHVVWEHDVDVYRKDNTAIPTLELKDFVSKEALSNYKALFAQRPSTWINCDNDLPEVPEMLQVNWLERLYFERLERKTKSIKPIFNYVHMDWEATLFVLLMRGFGTKVNANSFQSLAEKVTFSVVRKCAQSPFQLEALLLGLGDLLSDTAVDSYSLQLQGEFEFIKHKYHLEIDGILPIQFYKLRPDNFPTIRLSQVAQLYNAQGNLFQKLMSAVCVKEMYELLSVKASPYWDTHFSFGKSQKARVKKLTKSFMNLLIINAIIPLRFFYGQHTGKDESEVLLEMMQAIPAESNTIIKKYNSKRPKATNAQETQALIEMHSEYCKPNKCLSCAIGNFLIGKTP